MTTQQVLELLQRTEGSISCLAKGEKIYDLFTWDKVLQEAGDGGKVVICHRKQEDAAEEGDRQELVMKMRAKAGLHEASDQKFRKACQRVLGLPQHPGVVALYEVLEDERFYYVVMPRASGGALIQGLLEWFSDGVIPAMVLQKLLRETLEAIAHIHSHGVLHCDIKADNLVLEISHDELGNETRRVLLIDFDHANPDLLSSTQELLLDGFVGTPRFAAPETFVGRYSRQSDLYSVGVVLYLLVVGKMPHEDDLFSSFYVAQGHEALRDAGVQVYKRLRDAPVDFGSAAWSTQPECLDLCRSLLEFDPRDRPRDATEALKHAWFLLISTRRDPK